MWKFTDNSGQHLTSIKPLLADHNPVPEEAKQVNSSGCLIDKIFVWHAASVTYFCSMMSREQHCLGVSSVLVLKQTIMHKSSMPS